MNPFPPHSETDSFSLHRQDLTRLLLLSLALLTVILILQQVVLHDFPNSADEFAYLYQAHTFAEGRLANPAHEFQEFLSPFYILTSQEKVFSLFHPVFRFCLRWGDHRHTGAGESTGWGSHNLDVILSDIPVAGEALRLDYGAFADWLTHVCV